MKRRGSVFIVALFVLTAALSILTLTVQTRQVDMKATVNRTEGRRAKLMAQAGIQRALAELSLLTETGQVDQTQEWYTLGTQGNDRFTVGGDSFRMEILDAGSLVNLNSAPEQQLLNLGLTQEQVDCLLDWREPGTTARADGAKNDYYQTLPQPYNAQLGRMNSVTDVLLIKNWLPTTLYDAPANTTQEATPLPVYDVSTTDSFSPNVSASGQALTNINTAQLAQMVQAGLSNTVASAIIARRNGLGTFTSMSQVVTSPGLNNQAIGQIIDRFQVGTGTRTEGKINLNTASESVLDTLPGLTTDLVSAIISRQSSGFKNLSEVFQIPGFTAAILSQVYDRITIGSDTFVVRVVGKAGSSSASLEAVVRIQNGVPTVIKTLDTPESDMTTRWAWQTDATNDIDLLDVVN